MIGMLGDLEHLNLDSQAPKNLKISRIPHISQSPSNIVFTKCQDYMESQKN
jgi:hypothetical protein